MEKIEMKRFISCLLIAYFLLSGCSKSDTRSIVTEEAVQSVQITKQSNTDDSMMLSMNLTRSLNPLTNSDATVDNVFSLMYEKLIVINAAGKAEPNIAMDWIYNDTGSVIYIDLRNDVYFSDGSRLNAYDVAYSLKTIDNTDNSCYKNCLDNISNWTITGDYTMSVTFKNASWNNIYYLAIPVISRTLYGGEYAKADSNIDKALTTGLYKVESFQKPDKLTLTLSSNCFKGESHIEKITVQMVSDEKTSIALFAQGTTDMLAPTDGASIKSEEVSNKSAYIYTTNVYDFIGFNFNNPILKDRNIRQAIAQALNKDYILATVYLGNSEKAYTPVRASSWLYEVATLDYDYNLNVSKMLLEQSGWLFRVGNDKVRIKNDENNTKLSLRILVNSGSAERVQVANKLAEELKGIGFEILVEALENDEYLKRVENGNYDIVVGSRSISSFDYSSMLSSDGNIINYSSDRMDEYLKACKNAITDEEIIAAYSALQKYISQELPYISIGYRKSKVYLGNRIEGHISPECYNKFSGIENLLIRK